jgi:hypothetical protein
MALLNLVWGTRRKVWQSDCSRRLCVWPLEEAVAGVDEAIGLTSLTPRKYRYFVPH